MSAENDEDRLLRAVLHQNAESIFLARQRTERELERARETLQTRTAELAASLALMQATLDATADGIVSTDQVDRITAFNARFSGMWDLPGDALHSGDHRHLLHAMSRRMRDPDAFLAGVKAILAAAPTESFDVLVLDDGSVFERYSRVQRVQDRVMGRVWSYRDVTERARSETALREAKAQAEAASRSKSAFLAMMSHELRTPLNAIAGYTDLMDMGIQGSVTPEQRSSLQRIRASQRHLLALIDEILLHATLEVGALPFDLDRVGVRDAVTAAESLVVPQAWAKGITLDASGCDREAAALADPDRLQQILANLLTNAVKFTESGGRVAVRCSVVGPLVRIDVADTGIGVPADMVDAIFEPFVQVRSELTRTAHGTGLGLAISRALARAMNGELNVVSQEGKGSVFSLTLPVA